MAVTTIDIIPKTSSSPLSSNNPSMNKRWPPLADKTSLPYKLTTLSRQKLAREATAPDPDIRRCLGHFRLHCRSMEWAQKDMSTRINSFEMEDDESEDEEDRDDENKKLPDDRKDEDLTSIKPASTEPADKATSELETTTVHVSFHVSAPPAADKEKEKEGLLEKGRNCLEKTVQRKHFWPSPGQCLPVRIAG